jgi:triosephosphate isomerase (TIM)
MKRPFFFGNWKMNNGPSEARAFMAAFLVVSAPRDDRTIAVFPPALSLSAVRDARDGRTDILLGVQNVHTEEKGAFTGENSAAMARDAGAQLALVGHSERRHVFGETDEQVAKKCAIAQRNGLVPVLCVGEKLEQRDAGEADDVVVRQLRLGVSALSRDSVDRIVVAYEPVWAIGTGRSATPADASAMHAVIRSELSGLGGSNADRVPILYGGSCTRGNVEALLAATGVDGVLVGGASLDPEGWAAICRT